MNLHAHIESYSTDCDGAYERAYVMTMNDDELESGFGDIEFHNRVVSHLVNTYSTMYGGDLSVRKVGNEVCLIWNEQTEEGGRHIEATICLRDCEELESVYRDHSAEEMGY